MMQRSSTETQTPPLGPTVVISWLPYPTSGGGGILIVEYTACIPELDPTLGSLQMSETAHVVSLGQPFKQASVCFGQAW